MSVNPMNPNPGLQNVIQNQDDADVEARSYGVRSLRIVGGIQIGVGALCAILSLVGVMIGSINMSYYVGVLFSFDITCLFFSGWNVLTGMLPFCMNQKRRNSWRCLKIAYMVCSIVGAAVFMPTVFSLGVVGAVIRDEYGGGIVALPAFVAVLGMIEMIVSIVASSYCCCCSSFGNTERTPNVFVTAQQPGMWLNMPQTQIPNQQFLVAAVIPMTTTQTNNQTIGATTQQYQVPTATAQQYQMPPATTQQYQMPSATAQQYQMPSATAQQYQMPSATAQQYQMPSATAQQYQMPTATVVHQPALADTQPPTYQE